MFRRVPLIFYVVHISELRFRKMQITEIRILKLVPWGKKVVYKVDVSFLCQLCLSLAFSQMKVWDVQEMKCLGVLMGHTGSVKSMYSHPTNHGKFLVQ